MRALRGAIGVAAWPVAAATVLGLFGGLFWGFDLLSNFRLQYLLMLVPLAIGMAVAGGTRSAIALGAAALLNLALITPLYLGGHPAPSSDARLEVVSFNMQLSDPERQMPWILSHDPDIVLFLESSIPAEQTLRDLDLGYHVTSGIADDRRYGVTVLTKQPIDLERLPMVGGAGGAVRFQVELGDEQVAVYGIHPPSPSNPWRTLTRNEFMKEAGAMLADEDLPVIVVGDFNATPWSDAFRLLTRPAGLVNSQRGFGYSSTWPAALWPILRIPIDHLVYGGPLTVVDREVGPELDADHLPIRVVLAPAVP